MNPQQAVNADFATRYAAAEDALRAGVQDAAASEPGTAQASLSRVASTITAGVWKTCGCGHHQEIDPDDIREEYTAWRCEVCHRQNTELLVFVDSKTNNLTHDGGSNGRFTNGGAARVVIDKTYHGSNPGLL